MGIFGCPVRLSAEQLLITHVTIPNPIQWKRKVRAHSPRPMQLALIVQSAELCFDRDELTESLGEITPFSDTVARTYAPWCTRQEGITILKAGSANTGCSRL